MHLTISTFAISVLTLLPWTTLANPTPVSQCIPTPSASTLATNFGKLISAYSDKLANATLAPNFRDFSESVNTLIDNGGSTPKNLLSATFTSRSDFEAASAGQPAEPFEIKELWIACDVLIIRWLSAQSPLPVVGISVAHVVFNRPNWQIDEVWAEFDSAAWLRNLGFTITVPKGKREVVFEG
ncbi:hypothetical protein LTR86_009568 [Recurvomyces mirabilis]|nr:hypothetical protein LTR86_009568 [Recurvomyces mirabilis]